MRTISCKLEDLKNMVLHIGYEGENDYTSVRIDAGSVFAQYPEAVPSLKVQPPKGNMYPVIVTRDGDIVIWNVSDSDTASNGNGEIQLTFTENTVVVKSCTGKTLVHRSLKATGPAPDPLIDFIDMAEEVVEEAKDAAEAAEAAAQHAPMIGLDGYWYKWDAETEGYVKTDTKARGEDGANGVGITSVEKISTVGLVDTYRINFTNGTNTTYTVTNGQDGSVPIDDTTPAANKVFSSAKVDEELTDVKTAIQGKYTKPSGGIPATDMTEEVQNTLSAVGKSEERDGIVQTGDTATRNITKDRYVIWKGNLYTASANIATGETLSLSNLDPVSDGGFNALHEEIASRHSIKAYKKYVIQEEARYTWVALDNPVDLEAGDEIEILIYQSDKATSGTSWSNTEQWNAVTIQNKNHNSIQLQDWPYLNSSKPALIRITKKTDHFECVFYTNNTFKAFGVDFPDNFDSFDRMQLDAVSSTIKVGCTIEITIKNTL